VSVIPRLTTPIIDEEFNYTSAGEAAAGGWLLSMPNATSVPELVQYPSSFGFGVVPGSLRICTSRPQEFLDTAVPGQNAPVLAVNSLPLTGDFTLETRFTIVQPRLTDEARAHGIIITTPAAISEGRATGVTIDANTPYLAVGSYQVDRYATVLRLPGRSPVVREYDTGVFGAPTVAVRIVKRGAYFFTYLRITENGPWSFHDWVKAPELAATSDAPVVAGIFARSWGPTNTTTCTRYKDVDYHYFRAYRHEGESGTYTNVLDAGRRADWQSVSLDVMSSQGVKYQLRTGNLLKDSTLIDAGPFVGPDGTSQTWFTDMDSQTVPNPIDKRFLEYRLSLTSLLPTPDGTDAPNLPPAVRGITAVYQPTGMAVAWASDFDEGAGTLAVEANGGGLGPPRQVVFEDSFDGQMDGGWSLDPGYAAIDPNVAASATVGENPTALRMRAGYPQALDAGAADAGGVKLLRNLPAGLDDFEVETQVSTETQQGRSAGLLVWQDKDNFIALTASRPNIGVWEIGVQDTVVLNDLARTTEFKSYGCNTVQLRIARHGQVYTLAAREPSSPSWRVLRTINTTGLATGSTNFAPTRFGLLVTSADLADTSVAVADFDYFRVSTFPGTGERDIPILLPPGNRVDVVTLQGGSLSAANAQWQVRNPEGAFVGPDGTSDSWFTVDEPRLPSSLDGMTETFVRLRLNPFTTAGIPYAHAVGIQYTYGRTRVARDTNRSDFEAASFANGSDVSSVPGVVVGSYSYGAVERNNLDYPDNDLTGKPLSFSNTPAGHSSFSFTEAPGYARLLVGRPEDPANNGRAFLYRTARVSSDWEVETTLHMPNGRSDKRHVGLAVIAHNPNGTPPDGNLNLANLLLFGPLTDTAAGYESGLGLRTTTFGVTTLTAANGYTGDTFMLRVRKVGTTFTASWRPDALSPWRVFATLKHTGLNLAYMGLLGISESGPPEDVSAADFDYLTFSILGTISNMESRPLDLGASGLVPFLSTMGGNSSTIQFQFRGADTAEGLSAERFVGPDGLTTSTYGATFAGAITGVQGRRFVQYRVTMPLNAMLNDVGIIGIPPEDTPYTRDEALTALRVAAGLLAGAGGQMPRHDIAAPFGVIDIVDALRITRRVTGYERY
jgi:hypothetical protein